MKKIIGIFALSILIACGGGETSQEETGNGEKSNGEKLFKEKGCAACHTIGGGKLVGPDLSNVLDRRTEEEIIKFVKNPADFDVTLMAPQDVTDSEIKAILTYIKSKSPQTNETNAEEVNKKESSASEETPEEEVKEKENDISNKEKEDTNEEEEDVVSMVKAGELLFEGTKRFENGGPSCISCHNVDYEQMMQGGLLAKDLSKVYSRSGGMRGIKGILSGLPFPAMKSSYGNHPLTNQEIVQLQAFLKHADENLIYQHHGDKKMFLFYFALVGFLTVITIIYFLWFDRKIKGVKEDIYNRQIKSI
jgi:mono/diheme cytochrome c family protein